VDEDGARPLGGKFFPERHFADRRRRFGVVLGYSSGEIFRSDDSLASVEVELGALAKKNEAALRFLLTERRDFDK